MQILELFKGIYYSVFQSIFNQPFFSMSSAKKRKIVDKFYQLRWPSGIERPSLEL